MPKKKERIKRTVGRSLKQAMTPQEASEVIKEVSAEIASVIKEQPTGRVPGVVVRGNKTSYTYHDLCEMFPIVSFTPEETIPLTFNGVQVQALNGIEMHVPLCFKKLYDQHRQELRKRPSLPDSGSNTIMMLGAGALPPELATPL